jgi:DNA polymerase III alpha subunit
MPIRNFVTCHCHQASLDTASTPEAFAAKELELQTGYLTVTDHGTLNAARRVFDLAKKKNLKPIIGLEAYLRDDNCPILLASGVERDAAGTLSDYSKYFHVTMHFLDQEAYETGVRLLSKADARAERHGSERKPLFTWNDLEELGAKNVTMTSSCLVGVVQRHLLAHDHIDNATAYYEKMRGLCRPGNWYVEVFPHKCDKNWDSAGYITFQDGTRERLPAWKKLKLDGSEGQLKDYARHWKPGREEKLLAVMENRKWADREPKLVSKVEVVEDFIPNECRPWAEDGDVQKGANMAVLYLADKYGDKVLIGDDSHYAHSNEKIVQDIRLQAGGGTWRFYGHYHRQSSEEALHHFQRTLGVSEKEFEDWVENSYEWASKFKDFKFKERKSLPTSFYPDDTLSHTMDLIEKHGRMRWDNPVWVDRLEKEIDLLHNNGKIDLLPYFFIDEEVCDLYGRNGQLTGPGRGSAAGLLLTYLLRITHVDPIKYQLSMERFLTKTRIQSGKLPDIDQDLPNRELLVGSMQPAYEVKLSSGLVVTVPQDSIVETVADTGLSASMAISQAFQEKWLVTSIKNGTTSDSFQPARIVELKPSETRVPGWLDERFGACYAAISTDVSLKLRSAVKDVARVLHEGRIPEDIEMLTRRFENAPQGISDYDFVFGYKGSDGWVDGSINSDVALQEYVKLYPLEWDIVQKCLGLTRQKSKHACAYVIADEPVSNFIPLTSVGADQTTVTQYTAPYVEAVGGLKMDFLVINSLNDISQAIHLIQKAAGWEPHDAIIDGEKVLAHEIVPIQVGEHETRLYSIWKLPEDQAVFHDFCEGKTETVFQFNTPGAIGWLKNFDYVKETREDGTEVKALDSIEALSAFTALDRPGPLDYFVENSEGGRHNMLVEFANRAKGLERIGSLPVLDQLLPETYGVIVYQEQLQKVYQVVGQTTAEQADEFRVHISKKKMSDVIKDKAIFMPGAIKTLGDEAVADALWNSMETFGQYGFNKSHSTAYVVISYACAFLKHHFPSQWWTAVLSHADKDEINNKFWPHCGHLIDLPDVALSGEKFEIRNGRIQAPLSLLHGIGATAHAQIMRYRPYKDLEDFCQKIQNHREAGATIVKKMKKVKVKTLIRTEGRKKIYDEQEVEQEVEQKKLAHNALNKSVVATLVVSGAMDSFFPPGTATVEALQAFNEAMAKVAGKKKADKVDPKYLNLNPFAKYQMKKAVLPAYRELLVPKIHRAGVEGFKYREGQAPEFSFSEQDDVPFAMFEEIQHMDKQTPWPKDYRVCCAAAGYVLETRKFNYGGGKEACEITIQIDANDPTNTGIVKAVKWPERGGRLPPLFKDPGLLTGSVVVALYEKYSERPFGIRDIAIIEGPLDYSSSEQSPDSE